MTEVRPVPNLVEPPANGKNRCIPAHRQAKLNYSSDWLPPVDFDNAMTAVACTGH